jgi:group I intron endonuclease
MRTYYIYKYTNLGINEKTGLVNNKIYIGQCIDPGFRRRAHKSAALRGKTSCPLFYNAIRHYGYENFKFEIIESFTSEQEYCDERETFWIKDLDALNLDVGYNLSRGGKGNFNKLNTDTHKYCSSCDVVKLRSEFNKNKSRHDGIEYICRICYNEMMQDERDNMTADEKEEINSVRREKYAENPEKQIEQSKKYYSEHKEERAEYSKIYAQENAEEIAIDNHERYVANAEERKAYAKKDREKIKEENTKLGAIGICARTPIKNCNACKIDLDSTEFYIDLTASHGLSRNCKDCHKAKMAINRAKNKVTV